MDDINLFTPDEYFSSLIIGTGLDACIEALKYEDPASVLHIERTAYYGGASQQGTIPLEDILNLKTITKSFNVVNPCTHVSTETIPKGFLIDQLPTLISPIDAVGTLLTDLSLGHLEFVPILTQGVLFLNKDLKYAPFLVPKNKEQVMLDSFLTLIEKRQIMRLLKSQSDEEFQSFLSKASHHVQALLLFGICHLDTWHLECDAQRSFNTNSPLNSKENFLVQNSSELKDFVNSSDFEINKYLKCKETVVNPISNEADCATVVLESLETQVSRIREKIKFYAEAVARHSGLLYPYGGTGSIVQALCRLGAVRGSSVHLLNQNFIDIEKITGSLRHTVSGNFEGRTWKTQVESHIDLNPAQSAPISIIFAVAKIDANLFGEKGCSFWCIPPLHASDTKISDGNHENIFIKRTIFILQLDASSGCVPANSNQILIYLWTRLKPAEGISLLESTLKKLIEPDEVLIYGQVPML